ncbi:MAG TPA: chlorite dismutase family protein [Candidatus Saccharimonadia bacterium]|nr:chlorite dismutase family protein [Candidatus Saccharimonadia bacterium]
MNDWPYHQYAFFNLASGFYRLPDGKQTVLKRQFAEWLNSENDCKIEPYATLGFTPGTTFMLWLRAHEPNHLQDRLRDLLRTDIGAYISLSDSLFGLSRASQYSRGPQKSDQTILADERLPYLVIYPFTKTIDWHLLPFEQRKQIMRDHIMIGIKHVSIRQCLLYAYGVDNHEFIVSYETPTLPEFQDLVMELRGTEGRKYTANDLPIYTCIYKSPEDLVAWL